MAQSDGRKASPGYVSDRVLLWGLLVLALLPEYDPVAYSSRGRAIAYIVVVIGVGAASVILLKRHPSASYRHSVARAKWFWLMQAMVWIALLCQQFQTVNAGNLVSTLGYLVSAVLAFTIIPVAIAERLLDEWWEALAGMGMIVTCVGLAPVVLGLTNLFGISMVVRGGVLSPYGLPVVKGPWSHNLTYGMLCLQGCLGSLYVLSSPGKRARGVVALSVCGIGVMTSWARGPTVALATAACVWSFYTVIRGNIGKLGVSAVSFSSGVIVAIVGALALSGQLSDALYRVMDVSRGLGGRQEVIPVAFAALERNPWPGYGLGSVYYALVQSGGPIVEYYLGRVGTGAHNTFLDLSLAYGVPAGLAYLVVLAVALVQLLRADLDLNLKRTLAAATVALIAASQAVTYNIGGLRYMSLVLTVILGLSTASPWLLSRPGAQSNHISSADVHDPQ